MRCSGTIDDMKIAIVVNGSLPPGLAANTAAVLGVSIGRMLPEIVREPVVDGDGVEHAGITSVPIPILSADTATIAGIVATMNEVDSVHMVPFSTVAQRSTDYDNYARAMARTPATQMEYSGVALAGEAKEINQVCGSLALFR